MAQIQVSQRAAGVVFRTGCRELSCETRSSSHGRFQAGLVGKKHGAQQNFDRACDMIAGRVRLGILRNAHRLVSGRLLAERNSGLPVHAADQVMQTRLVSQDHERHQIAMRGGIGRHIEAPLERVDIGAALHIEPIGMLFVRERHVSHVALAAVGPRNVPTTPSLFQRTAVIGHKGACVKFRGAVRRCKYRAHQQTGDADRFGGGVTLQALLAAHEFRLCLGALIQCVEHRSLVRVDSG